MLTRFAAFCVLFLVAAPALAQENFDAFVRQAWPDAQAKGITRATFDAAMKGVTPDQRVIDATRRQPEYGKPVGDYVNGIVATSRIGRGQAKEREWRKTFDAVEQRFQVERWILIALWAIESDYGAAKDKWDIFRSLSTLGYVKYRHPYFRNELFVAIKIMQDNKFPREKMLSSWAGAIGQSQFMPSNVIDYAIDFSGDGRVDLWDNVPDVLGSTGNYLRKGNWKHGLPWGFEVTVPRNFDYMLSRGSFSEWTQRGVRRSDGKPFPGGSGILFFPSGYKGPGFIVTENFDVLKEYNNSDAYAITVGHLADRMQGGPPIAAKWPADDRPLPRDARIALQRKLASLGYKVNEFEGHVDFDLRDNIRAEQKKLGMVPDGNPTPLLLEKLGVKVN
ncbi:lytic murein transglycosylase [Microbacteriaceae bacterium K1510]|nr:lytic murein transglycosylase [Microbacteriaceae bacterium K1510]